MTDRSPALGWPRRLVGIGLVLVAVFMALAQLMVLIDPTAKLADDADPFGPAASTSDARVWLVVSVVLGAIGLGLALWNRKPVSAHRPAAERPAR
jgi:hypothetical protein